jgi:hypothetical protein
MEHRTYLWLYLAIDDIRTMFKDSLRPDKESIQLIPRSVNAAYRKILDRVTPEQMPTVRYPLTIHEMAMALGVATSTRVQTAAEAMVNPGSLGEKNPSALWTLCLLKDFKIYHIPYLPDSKRVSN